MILTQILLLFQKREQAMSSTRYLILFMQKQSIIHGYNYVLLGCDIVDFGR
jgi:hypothetical protein